MYSCRPASTGLPRSQPRDVILVESVGGHTTTGNGAGFVQVTVDGQSTHFIPTLVEEDHGLLLGPAARKVSGNSRRIRSLGVFLSEQSPEAGNHGTEFGNQTFLHTAHCK